jgi:hypothetical protein
VSTADGDCLPGGATPRLRPRVLRYQARECAGIAWTARGYRAQRIPSGPDCQRPMLVPPVTSRSIWRGGMLLTRPGSASAARTAAGPSRSPPRRNPAPPGDRSTHDLNPTRRPIAADQYQPISAASYMTGTSAPAARGRDTWARTAFRGRGRRYGPGVIVGVHGIRNYSDAARSGSVTAAADEVSTRWAQALHEGIAAYQGVTAFGDRPLVPTVPPPEVRVAYYAHLLHRGTPQGSDDPAYLDEDAQELLIDWVDQIIPAGAAPIPLGTRTYRARAVGEWLTGHLGEQVLGFALTFAREVSIYLRSARRRQAVRDSVGDVIAERRPRIVIAHSLGSVVTYETLWQHPELTIDLLITVGSPLAMPTVIFPRLEPRPVGGQGQRPPGVAAWANLADIGDIVAIPREGLAPHFAGVTLDKPAIVIDKNAFHRVQRYLAARETVEVLLPYIAGAAPVESGSIG